MKRILRICVFCLPVLVLVLGLLTVTLVAAAENAQTPPSESAPAISPESRPAGEAVPDPSGAGLQMLWALIGIFFGGMALNLTPCVYPLIPVTISYFGAKSFGEAKSPGRIVALHGLLYVLGLAAMNSMLGVVAALSGRMLGNLLQNPLTLIFVALILVLFACSMFGAWEFRLPSIVTGTASRTFAGYFGSLFIGLTLGIVAAPCIGPFVVGILVWVAGTGDPVSGFLVFFSLSLGMGVPLFVLAILSGRLKSLPRSGEWMLWVRKLLGWVLLGMASYFVRPVMPGTSGILLTAALLLAAGVHLGFIDRSSARFQAFRFIKAGTGVLGIVLALYVGSSPFLVGEGVKWTPYTEKALEDAIASGRPVVVDFYADWCAPCRMMDRLTFRDAGVMEAAERDFVMIRVDLTRREENSSQKLARRFRVMGVPTVVFLEPGGAENRELRVSEFTEPDRFLARMKEVGKAGGAAGTEKK
ncbi:MAG: thioredoxin family protein [Desulfobacteraceae bacterium]|nr:thioredoxin family protein [Desulfobacteraceae bacterium]